MIELHNEYTNAFSRIDPESCFYKNALWLVTECGMLTVKRDRNTLLLMETSNRFYLGQHEKVRSYRTLGKFGSLSPSGATVRRIK